MLEQTRGLVSIVAAPMSKPALARPLGGEQTAADSSS
jgi:hypothetical protein